MVNALAGMPATSAEESEDALRQAEYVKELEESAEFRVVEAVSNANAAIEDHRVVQQALNVWRRRIRRHVRMEHASRRLRWHLCSQRLARCFRTWDRLARSAGALQMHAKTTDQQKAMSDELTQVTFERQRLARSYDGVEKALRVFHGHFLRHTSTATSASMPEEWTADAAIEAASSLSNRSGMSSLFGACFNHWRNYSHRMLRGRLKLTLVTREEELEITSTALERHVRALNECTTNYLELRKKCEEQSAVLDKNKMPIAWSDTEKERLPILMRTFTVWYQRRLHARRVKTVLARTVSRMQQKRLGDYFVSWAHHVTHSASLRMSQQKDILAKNLEQQGTELALKNAQIHAIREDAARLSSEMARQKRTIEEERQVRLNRTISRWFQMTLAGALERWMEYVVESARQRHVLDKIVRRMAHANVSAAFVAWAQRYRAKQRATAIVMRVMAQWRNRCVLESFSVWVEFVEELLAQRQVAADRQRFGELEKQKSELEDKVLSLELAVTRGAAENESLQRNALSALKSVVLQQSDPPAPSGEQSAHKLGRQLKHSLLKVAAVEARLRSANEESVSTFRCRQNVAAMHSAIRISWAVVTRLFKTWLFSTMRCQLNRRISIGGRLQNNVLHQSQLRSVLGSWRTAVREAARLRTNTICRHLDAVANNQVKML